MATETDPKQTPAAPDAPEAISLDQVRSIMSGMLKTALPKVVQEALGASLKTAIEEELKPIREKLTAAPSAPEKAKKDDDKSAPEVDPRIAEFEKKLAKMHEENRQFRAQAEAERKRARETKAYGDLRQQLNGKVRSEAVDMVADLMKARGIVAYDEDGNVSMKVRRAIAKGMPEEDADLPLSEALPYWLSSKEAQLFLPPPATANDGKRAGFNGQPPRPGSAIPRGSDPAAIFESLHGSLDDHLI